jgi:hypothetical protein
MMVIHLVGWISSPCYWPDSMHLFSDLPAGVHMAWPRLGSRQTALYLYPPIFILGQKSQVGDGSIRLFGSVLFCSVLFITMNEATMNESQERQQHS